MICEGIVFPPNLFENQLPYYAVDRPFLSVPSGLLVHPRKLKSGPGPVAGKKASVHRLSAIEHDLDTNRRT